jgi:hypothetical protein
MLELDQRIEGILAARMKLDLEGIDLVHYQKFDKEKWGRYPVLVKSYNDLLTTTNLFQDKYSYYRSCYVFWPPMNDTYKLQEIQRFLAGEESTVKRDDVDFEWLNTFDPELSKKVAQHIVATNSYGPRGTLQIIRGASEEILKEMEQSIFKMSKGFQLQLLSNPHTPESWLDSLLRVYAKRTRFNVPDANRKLSSDVLNKLPPIIRLEVIERLVFKSNGQQLIQVLPDVRTGEDFRSLLFGALTRHSDRVIEVIRQYNNKTGQINGWSYALDIF